MDLNLWWSHVKTALIAIKLDKWVLEVRGRAVEGHDAPDIDQDLDGYVDWVSAYMRVRSVLESSLGSMLPVIISERRYTALGEYGTMLDRIKVIRAILEEYAQLGSFDDDLEINDDVSTSARNLNVPVSRSNKPPPPPQPNFQQQISGPTAAPVSSVSVVSSRSRPQAPHVTPTPKRHKGSNLTTPARPPDDIRVYFNPKQTQASRAELFRARKHASTWGWRCCICGHTDVRGDGHKTWDCAATHFSTEKKELVMCKYKVEKSKGYFEVVRGEKKGTRVCFKWNLSRTIDGRCYEPDCRLDHRCSLCLKPEHRAMDCPSRVYLPLLPPRPNDLPGIDVDLLLAGFDSKKSLTPASTPATQSSNAVASSSKSVSAPKHASHSRYRIHDQFSRPRAKPSSVKPATVPKIFTDHLDPPPTPAEPKRYDMYSNYLYPMAQSYPATVPKYVLVRPGYQCRILKSQLLDGLPAEWVARLEHVFVSASKLQVVSDLEDQRSRDEALWDLIQAQEKSSKVSVSRWENREAGKVGRGRFQRSDGDTHKSGIAILGHYPPMHGSGHAFTSTKDGTYMLGKDGLQSPGLSGNYQLSFNNTLPIHFEVDHLLQSLTIRNPTGSKRATTSYPKACIDLCIREQANDIILRLRNGASQINIAYGVNPGAVHELVATLAQAAADIDVSSKRIMLRRPRMWEMGCMSLQTLLLGQRHGASTRMIGIKESLFKHEGADLEENSLLLADKRPLSEKTAMVFDFTFISCSQYPDRAIILYQSDHMSAATSAPKGGDRDTAPKLDIISTLLEDLYHDRFGGSMFPRPTWKFSNRRIQSQLDETDPKDGKYHGLGQGVRRLLTGLNDSLEGYVNADLLPERIRKVYQDVELISDDKGVEVNAGNVIDVILQVDAMRVDAMKDK